MTDGRIDGPARGRATRFFLWCAGADTRLLEPLPGSETIKQVGFGTLVVVPAVLALFSMTYALSTLTDRVWVFVAGGLVWALIVFCFDRFIVSTFRKSRLAIDDVTSLVFVSRVVFAGFVGVLVAHPLVMLYFSDTIEERLAFERRTKVAAIEDDFRARQASVSDAIGGLKQEVRERELERNEAQQRLVDEIDGVVSGRTSGIPGRGASAEQKQLSLQIAQQELEAVRDRNLLAIADFEREREELRRDSRESQSAYRQPLDYLARAGALESLAAEYPHIERVKWFLILFFVFVDTLPILFKGLTSRGPYDDLIQLEEFRSELETRAEREGLDQVYPLKVVTAENRELDRLQLRRGDGDSRLRRLQDEFHLHQEELVGEAASS